MKVHRPEACPVQAKFRAAREELSAALIEREEEIDVALTALVAGEHPLLVGPPGCGKSLLLDALLAWAGGRRFSVMLTKFSVPEEVFGPVCLAGLREGRYRRVTAGKLPEADFAFVDEVFKASSAILNTLLKVLNERTFDDGGGVARRVPLRMCLAAGNEWPSPETGAELSALFDRFALRKEVRPVATAAGRSRLLWGEDHAPRLSTALSAGDLDAAQAGARALPWSSCAREALEAVLRELAREGVRPGDRRQVKAVGVARAYAWLAGSPRVEPDHLEVLQHVLWDDPREQPRKAAQVIARVANPAGMRVGSLLAECEQILAATDAKNLAQAAAAAAKLGEVERRLAAVKGDDRAERARAYVRDRVRRLRLDSIEAV